MFEIALIAGVVSLATCWLIVCTRNLHARFTGDVPGSGPQKQHKLSVPRVGGLGIAAGMVIALVIAEIWATVETKPYWYFLIAATPAFAGGIAEDITKRVGPLPRLLLTMASAAIAYFALGAAVERIDIPGIDNAFQYWGLSFLFTVFVVGGVAHAVNIIDGFNGLASGVSVFALAGVAAIAAANSDTFVASIAISFAAATVGFMLLNYPHGRIFLGDGGAYLVGTALALSCVLLVSRNPEVSAWAPALLLAHPVVETIYSIYRRVVVKGRSASQPDKLHLHSLMHNRIASKRMPARMRKTAIARNASTSLPFWMGGAITSIAAFLLHTNTLALIAACAIATAMYLWVYRRIVRFETHVARMKRVQQRRKARVLRGKAGRLQNI